MKIKVLETGRQTLGLAVGASPSVGAKTGIAIRLLDAGTTVETEAGVAVDDLGVTDLAGVAKVAGAGEVGVCLVGGKRSNRNHGETSVTRTLPPRIFGEKETKMKRAKANDREGRGSHTRGPRFRRRSSGSIPP